MKRASLQAAYQAKTQEDVAESAADGESTTSKGSLRHSRRRIGAHRHTIFPTGRRDIQVCKSSRQAVAGYGAVNQW